ncbi:unnamed protein product [Arabis nemorensis]|uniref:Uncharacterized protein n=1 Tax=Arabis nemorensis TaxID=586526 RepID=A0A565CI13_9BRAS|nr:unnamed protein product [Arabis nemorensis]
MSSPIQIDSHDENLLGQNPVSSSSAFTSRGLSLMEAQTLALVHKARLSRKDDAESSLVVGPWSNRHPVETGTPKATGSSKVGGSIPPGLGVAVRDLIAALLGPLTK